MDIPSLEIGNSNILSSGRIISDTTNNNEIPYEMFSINNKINNVTKYLLIANHF